MTGCRSQSFSRGWQAAELTYRLHQPLGTPLQLLQLPLKTLQIMLRLRQPLRRQHCHMPLPSQHIEHIHARSSDGRVKDASGTSPAPASVTVTVLSMETTGIASAELLATVAPAQRRGRTPAGRPPDGTGSPSHRRVGSTSGRVFGRKKWAWEKPSSKNTGNVA